jgi:hypothetical protein
MIRVREQGSWKVRCDLSGIQIVGIAEGAVDIEA